MVKEENTFPLKFHLKLHSKLYIFFCAELNLKSKRISLFIDFLLRLLSQEKDLISSFYQIKIPKHKEINM